MFQSETKRIRLKHSLITCPVLPYFYVLGSYVCYIFNIELIFKNCLESDAISLKFDALPGNQIQTILD